MKTGETFLLGDVECLAKCCDPGNILIEVFKENFDFIPQGLPPYFSDLSYNCICQNGSYCINTNANLKCSNLNSVEDFNQIGQFLIVEGDENISDKIIWTGYLDVEIGKKYGFGSSVFHKLDSFSNSPELWARFNGTFVNGIDTLINPEREWFSWAFCSDS